MILQLFEDSGWDSKPRHPAMLTGALPTRRSIKPGGGGCRIQGLRWWTDAVVYLEVLARINYFCCQIRNTFAAEISI